MLQRKIVPAALMAVGVFVSLEYTSLAQSSQPATQPNPGTTSQPGTMTQPSPGTTSQPGTNLSATDREFITQAAQGGMAEVELGQLARKRASSKTVRQYAERMIQEHTKANKELMKLATQKGITPPTTIGPKYEAVREKLSKLSGRNFDREYLQQAGVTAHTEQQALYQRQVQQGQDPQLKAFAAKTLPIVQHHLKAARALTGKSAGTNTNTQGSTR